MLPYVYVKDPPNKSWLESEGECGRGAFFYVQVPCTIPQDQAVDRKLFGLLTGCITILIYLFVVVYFDYLKSKQMVNYVDWDVKTITAGDYSVEFDIMKKTYDRWKSRYFDERNPMSENAQFKLYLQNELEARVNGMPDMGYDEKKTGDGTLRIA